MKFIAIATVLSFNSLYAEQEYLTSDEMLKKAIIKLIQTNAKLEARVENLEKSLAKIESNQQSAIVPHEKGNSSSATYQEKSSYFFTSKANLSVRESPSLKAQFIRSLKPNDKVQINEINCKSKEMGFWGKTNQGWIYLANPNYGELTDKAGKKLSQDFMFWCAK